jgi:ABC-2 type transport system permease protein
LVRRDIKEEVRTYRLWVTLAIFLVFGITAPLIMKNLPKLIPQSEMITVIVSEPTVADAASQFFDYLLQLGMLLMILLGMGCVAGERAQGVLPLVLSKPVKRREFLASKVLVNGGMMVIALALGAAVFYGYTVLVFEYFSPVGVLQSVIPAALFLLLILAITIFWSVLAPSSIAAAGLAFLTAIIITVVPSLFPAIKRYGPSYLLESSKAIAAGGKGLADPLAAMLVSAGLIIILLIAAVYLFESRDI